MGQSGRIAAVQAGCNSILMKTFICVASGPSLTANDCALASGSGYPVIAVNSSWRAVPDCQHIYAADFAWWDQYHDSLTVSAERWTQSRRANSRYGVKLFRPSENGPFNSGQRAIQLAAHLGAEKVILLGYDCTLENGAHWHGSHPATMHNPVPREVIRWHEDFSSLAGQLPGVEIINASRHTALTCFRLSTLEAEI
ncbi:hypothetical protein [Enterobacter asburiae]|uniref:hypothetical protein n=1 Tax=Enterobacter asburiae TaxID=61645 RepID=UPI00210C44CC|nr:hypothetical protein [Enterobacter asburiae]MCQ4370003.1 hypothetical protein [Enterobacter asburiae]